MKWTRYDEGVSSEKRLAKLETFTEDEDGNIKSKRQANWQFPSEWSDDDIVDWFIDKYDEEGNWSRCPGTNKKVTCAIQTSTGFKSYNLTILK